ncbi:hypothetical protein ES705_38282 [subsurface metagenome]
MSPREHSQVSTTHDRLSSEKTPPAGKKGEARNVPKGAAGAHGATSKHNYRPGPGRSQARKSLPPKKGPSTRSGSALKEPVLDRPEGTLTLMNVVRETSEHIAAAKNVLLRVENCRAVLAVWEHRCGARVGVLRRCRHRFCPFCADVDAANLWLQHLDRVEHFAYPAHLVLTATNVRKNHLAEGLDVLGLALYRFKRSSWWKSNVDQAAVGLGLTYNRNAKSWNPHWHLLGDVEWARQAALRRAWSDALGSRGGVRVRRAFSVSGLFREILRGSRDDADRLLKLPHDVLGEAAIALKGRRRFRFLGTPPEPVDDVPPVDVVSRSKALCPECDATFRWDEWESSVALVPGIWNPETERFERPRSTVEAVTGALHAGFRYEETVPLWAFPKSAS